MDVTFKKLAKHEDDRGIFVELLRSDWTDFLQGDKIEQVNFSVTKLGVTRAWHRHSRGQVDYLVVIEGTVKVGVYNEESNTIYSDILDENELKVMRIPEHYWHGYKNIGDKPCKVIYFTTKLYDYQNPDEERRPSDSVINPLTGKPYEW